MPAPTSRNSTFKFAVIDLAHHLGNVVCVFRETLGAIVSVIMMNGQVQVINFGEMKTTDCHGAGGKRSRPAASTSTAFRIEYRTSLSQSYPSKGINERLTVVDGACMQLRRRGMVGNGGQPESCGDLGESRISPKHHRDNIAQHRLLHCNPHSTRPISSTKGFYTLHLIIDDPKCWLRKTQAYMGLLGVSIREMCGQDACHAGVGQGKFYPL